MKTPRLNLLKIWRISILVALTLTCISTESFAQSRQSVYQSSHSSETRDLGLGLMLGLPTGVTLKYWNSNTTALNFGLSYALGNYFALIGDYLWHFPSAFKAARLSKNGHELIPYAGLGGVFFVNSSYGTGPFLNEYRYPGVTGGNSGAAIGVRVPVGMEFFPKATPIGIFAELAPGMSLVPAIVAFFQGEVGARFYF